MPTLGDFFERLEVWIKNSNNKELQNFFIDWQENTKGPQWAMSKKLEIVSEDALELINYFVEEVRESYIDNPQKARISIREKTKFATLGFELLTGVDQTLKSLLPVPPITINTSPVSNKVM